MLLMWHSSHCKGIPVMWSPSLPSRKNFPSPSTTSPNYSSPSSTIFPPFVTDINGGVDNMYRTMPSDRMIIPLVRSKCFHKIHPPHLTGSSCIWINYLPTKGGPGGLHLTFTLRPPSKCFIQAPEG